MNNIDFTYLHQPVHRHTFVNPKVREWVEHWSLGKVLNLFAGPTKLDLDEIRVDLDPEIAAHHTMDAKDFPGFWRDQGGYKFDTVILDPPYNYRKAREKYEGRMIGNLPRLKDDLLSIIANDARVISMGWDSVGMGRTRGFEKIALVLVCHSGGQRDTIGVVEQRRAADLLNWEEKQ